MVSYGISSLNCVWKCNKGFLYSCSPKIQDFAGENVCIHVITPAQSSASFASWNNRRMEPLSSKVGFQTISNGKLFELFKLSTMILECSATFFKHSSP